MLNDTWTVYYHAKNAQKKYNDNTEKLIEFNTIEYFWRTFNNIPKPTDMFSEPGLTKKLKRTGEVPGAISVFRSNSYPSWEHETNFKGFEWSLRKYKDFEEFNTLWILLLITAIGEDFEHSKTLNGVRIVDCTVDNKLMYRIECWFSDKNHKEYFENKIKKLLDLPYYTKLLYREHSTLKENIKVRKFN